MECNGTEYGGVPKGAQARVVKLQRNAMDCNGFNGMQCDAMECNGTEYGGVLKGAQARAGVTAILRGGAAAVPSPVVVNE